MVTFQKSSSSQFGIVFSCNDKVYDWAVTFLESIREFNPDISLVLIPYNDQCDRILSLKSRFNFSVFSDDSLEELDRIGHRLHLGATGHAHHSFRRLAAFWGPLENFLYIDVDIAILHKLDFLFDIYRSNKTEILYYDRELNQVYLEGSYRSEVLQKGRNTGFNSGFWLSRKGLLSKEAIFSLADKAENLVDNFNIRNADQPFLNFIADELNLNVASFPELKSDLSLSIWARGKNPVQIPSGYMDWEHGGLNHRKLIIALHWAGTKISPAMPCHNIYLNYRYKNESFIYRSWRNLYWKMLRPFQVFSDRLRRNYLINKIYKKLWKQENINKPFNVRQNLESNVVS